MNVYLCTVFPVGRGEEVTDDIIDGKKSVVWQQAYTEFTHKKVLLIGV